jgi:hypothetical protein
MLAKNGSVFTSANQAAAAPSRARDFPQRERDHRDVTIGTGSRRGGFGRQRPPPSSDRAQLRPGVGRNSGRRAEAALTGTDSVPT